MESRVLKDFIKKCPLTDFSDGVNKEERTQQLDEYLDDFTSYIYEREYEFSRNFWENSFGLQQFAIIQQSPLLRRCFVFFDIAIGVLNFISTKYIKNRKSTETADMLSVHLQYSFNLFKSILILAMNECYYSVIAEYRTMYENYVITKYLMIHPELISIYHDHSRLIELYINKQSPFCSDEQKEEYVTLIEKYGDDFSKDFGWTKSVITNPKKRKLITMVNECEIEPFFEPLYKISCEYAHASSLASTTKSGAEIIRPFLQVAMFMMDAQIEDLINECKVVTREGVLLRCLISKIFDDFNCTFFQ